MSPESLDILSGIISLICVLIGTTGNIFAVSYFLSRSPTMTANTFIYSCINITDILISSLALFPGLAFLSGHIGEVLFANTFLCNMWGMLWNITIRMSVYLIAVLCLSRVVTLYRPYSKISLLSVVVPIVCYVLLMVVQAVIPYFHQARYTYFPVFKLCAWKLSALFSPGAAPFRVWYFVFNILEFVVPVFPVIGSCFFMVFKLRTKETSNRMMSTIKRDATITIILLTITYLVWNLPLCVITSLNYISLVSSNRLSFSYPTRLRIFINTQTILLNSVCNTCLYFYRIVDLRQWSLGVVRGWVGLVRSWVGRSGEEFVRRVRGCRRDNNLADAGAVSGRGKVVTVRRDCVVIVNHNVTRNVKLPDTCFVSTPPSQRRCDTEM